MSPQTIQLTPALREYLLQTSVHEHPLLERLRHETQQLEMARMQIAPEQGAFMGMLVELIGARRTLEVGVFTGYSALAVALALPADGVITACDVSVEWTAIAQRYFAQAGLSHKFDLRIAPAAHTLESLLAQGFANTYDFAFIDADKENYPAYFEYCLRLVRPGGLIAVDNVLWSGRVIDPSDQTPNTVGMRAFNQALFQDTRITLSMLPMGDGLTLARKRLPSARQ